VLDMNVFDSSSAPC